MQDKGQQVIFDHGDPFKARVDASAALNGISFTPPAHTKRSVQRDLWAGRKANDLSVTMHVHEHSGACAAKAAQWCLQESSAVLASEAYATSISAALCAAAAKSKARAAAETRHGISCSLGSASHEVESAAPISEIVGCGNPEFQASKGTSTNEFLTEASKPYRKLHFRHPIPYTIHPVAHAPVSCALDKKVNSNENIDASVGVSAQPMTSDVPPQATAA